MPKLKSAIDMKLWGEVLKEPKLHVLTASEVIEIKNINDRQLARTC